MVRDFFIWWLDQLASNLPRSWRRLRVGAAYTLVLSPDAALSHRVDGVSVSLRRNSDESVVGRYQLDDLQLAQVPRPTGTPVVLRVTGSDILAKTVVLPIAAERQLDQVLAFEMDRETPFSAGDVFWNGRITRRDRKIGKIWVRLLLLPKARSELLLSTLERADMRPHGAEVTSGPDRGAYLAFDVGGAKDASSQRLAVRMALACSIILALAAVAIPLGRQSLALANIEDAIAADRIAASEAQKLRQEIDNLSGKVNLIEVERAKRGQPLETLTTLTRLLPSDTYLTDLVQQQRKVTFTGRSAATTRLIAILSGEEQLRNVAFAAPIIRNEMSRLETFTISAEVAP